MSNELKLKFKHNELVDIWSTFCDQHRELYELTTLEYSALLESRIEDLEDIISRKEVIISQISTLEDTRQEIVESMSELTSENIEKLTDLFPIIKKYNLDPANTIEKYNLLLLDIIDKIQDQNKKNQIFLNRAILSLQDLRNQFQGKKNFKTYNNKGNTLSP